MGMAFNSIINNSAPIQNTSSNQDGLNLNKIPNCPPGYALSYSNIGFSGGDYTYYCSKK